MGSCDRSDLSVQFPNWFAAILSRRKFECVLGCREIKGQNLSARLPNSSLLTPMGRGLSAIFDPENAAICRAAEGTRLACAEIDQD